jgi:valyl-tRNA synthetase
VRPETKFGEKVIVVHPNDERYKQYVGTTIKAQIATGEVLDMTVIADEAIKPEFGTGAMTITPAHDPIDFEIAQRHNLPIVPIIGFDGKLLPIAGQFAGMKVAEARTKIAAALEELGLLEKVDPTYKHSVALCYKSMQPIEPMIMPQWYIKVKPLVEPVIAAIERGEVRYVPESAKKVQLDWLRNLRDWNISRQIWWGIPIDKAMPENPEIAHDPDTFDTWFSSAQWPLAVLESLGNKDGRDWVGEFYPTAVMETGRDIIFFWVTRMLMMGLYLTGKVPFSTVYLHGLVQDKHGKKMSKSKGNVVSPLDLTAKYGADGVRFGLVIGSSSVDMPLPEEKMVGGRNFANKLWNMARFVRRESNDRIASAALVAVTEADVAILEALNTAVAEATDHLEACRMPQALQVVHQFAWAQFADIYLEAAKNQRADDGYVNDTTLAILQHALKAVLTMTHPYMPFVTEAIWQRLEFCEGMLITAPWPVATK